MVENDASAKRSGRAWARTAAYMYISIYWRGFGSNVGVEHKVCELNTKS